MHPRKFSSTYRVVPDVIVMPDYNDDVGDGHGMSKLSNFDQEDTARGSGMTVFVVGVTVRGASVPRKRVRVVGDEGLVEGGTRPVQPRYQVPNVYAVGSHVRRPTAREGPEHVVPRKHGREIDVLEVAKHRTLNGPGAPITGRASSG